MTENQEIFRTHLRRDADYLMGEDVKWRLVEEGWPESIFEVRAKCGKWWGVKIDLDGYPDEAPQGILWNCHEGTNLPRNELPLGSLNADPDNYDEACIYTTFHSHYPELYCPFDGTWCNQSDWEVRHPQHHWNRNRNIAFYLEKMHGLLNSRDYHPPGSIQKETIELAEPAIHDSAMQSREALEKDLQCEAFLSGVGANKWCVLEKGWPESMFAIRAKCGQYWNVKVDFRGYPHVAPRGILWDCHRDEALWEQELPQGLIATDSDGDDDYDHFDYYHQYYFHCCDRDDPVFRAFHAHYPDVYCPPDGSWEDTRRYQGEDGQCPDENNIVVIYLEKLHVLLNSKTYYPPRNKGRMMQEILNTHLRKHADYRMGVGKKKWRLVRHEGLECIFEVRAKCGKWWAINVDFLGYPQFAPRGVFWDCHKGEILPRHALPRGSLVLNPCNYDAYNGHLYCRHGFSVDAIFTAFHTRYPGLFCAFDRVGTACRDSEWEAQQANNHWTMDRTVGFYLEKIHDLLNSDDYRRP